MSSSFFLINVSKNFLQMRGKKRNKEGGGVGLLLLLRFVEEEKELLLAFASMSMSTAELALHMGTQEIVTADDPCASAVGGRNNQSYVQ